MKVNGDAAKPATAVRVGDRVTARVHDIDRDLEVVALIDKRVGAAIAVRLLRRSLPAAPEVDRSRVAERERGTGRPTKRDRREMDRWRPARDRAPPHVQGLLVSTPLDLHFVTSADHLDRLPPSRAEVAVVGRSNVGKSSLINALGQAQRLANVSKTPGRTQLLNCFELPDGATVVDCPGYGYAKVSKVPAGRDGRHDRGVPPGP